MLIVQTKLNKQDEFTEQEYEDAVEACRAFVAAYDTVHSSTLGQDCHPHVVLLERITQEDGSTADYPHFEVYY